MQSYIMEMKLHNYIHLGNRTSLFVVIRKLPWVFGAFIEVNSSYFNTNGFYINTVIFSNTVIFFYGRYTVCYFSTPPSSTG